MLGKSACEVAEFLLAERRLHPTQVGDYLGENDKWARCHNLAFFFFGNDVKHSSRTHEPNREGTVDFNWWMQNTH